MIVGSPTDSFGHLAYNILAAILAIHPCNIAGFSIKQIALLAHVGNGRPDFTRPSIEICGADVSLLYI